ncbi:MAG: hypothetical protein Q8P80_04640 [Candidatus Levybacteria bacterium]|nr:hypothetical protein [Candidatus Levybacteria bacterium]
MSEINLISKRRNELLKSKKVLGIVRIVSGICLFFVLISSFAVFFLKFSSSLPSLKSDEENLLSDLSRSKMKLTKYSVVKDRLVNISDILSKRIDFDSIITLLVNDSPSDFQVDSVIVDKTKISLSATSGSLSSVNLFLNKLIDMSLNKKVFGKINLDNLSLDPTTGKYVFAVSSDLL